MEKIKVIVIDDEIDTEIMFRQKFSKEIKGGLVEFQFFTEGKPAVDFVNGARLAELTLIITDIQLPDINGLDLLKTFKEKDPALKVFMITGFADNDRLRIAEENGADDFLRKPINLNELKEKILALK